MASHSGTELSPAAHGLRALLPAGRALAGLLLAAFLLAAPGHTASPNGAAADGARSATDSAPEPSVAVATRTADRAETEALATLAILAFGIGGLLWVRRHVADL